MTRRALHLTITILKKIGASWKAGFRKLKLNKFRSRNRPWVSSRGRISCLVRMKRNSISSPSQTLATNSNNNNQKSTKLPKTTKKSKTSQKKKRNRKEIKIPKKSSRTQLNVLRMRWRRSRSSRRRPLWNPITLPRADHLYRNRTASFLSNSSIHSSEIMGLSI